MKFLAVSVFDLTSRTLERWCFYRTTMKTLIRHLMKLKHKLMKREAFQYQPSLSTWCRHLTILTSSLSCYLWTDQIGCPRDAVSTSDA